MNSETLLLSEGSSSNLLYELVSKELISRHKLQNENILDLGCGQGVFLNLLHSKGLKNLYGSDGYHYPEMNTNNITFLPADLNQKLPFENNQFNFVSSIEVIEHLENPRQYLREIKRILKPGGWIILSTPNNESITSILSLLTRGYFSSFSNRCYPAHITPVLEIDMKRILKEININFEKTIYTNQGRIPKTSINWQKIIPFCRGRLFSDNYIVIGRKPNEDT